MTGLEILSAALKETGYLAAGETLNGDDSADALVGANNWIDGLGTQRATMYALLRTVKTLSSGTASYMIGAGGSINIVRPLRIERAGLILDSTADPTTEVPIRVFTDDEWASIPQKDLDGTLIQGIYYDFAWTAGLATVKVWPVPTVSALQVVLYTPQALTELALATDYTFLPGYRRALVKGLAVELGPQFSAVVSDDLRQQALDAMGNVKRANFRLSEMPLNPLFAGGGAFYNIETDG